MKNTKLALLTLAISAVLASALAFKAANFSNHFIYTGTLGSGSCTTKVVGAKIWSGPPNVAASTAPTTIGCPDTCFEEVDD